MLQLFADEGMGAGGWATILTAVFGTVIALGGFVIAYFNNATRLMKRVDELTNRMFSLQDEASDCKQRESDLKAELSHCSQRIRAIETATGMSPPPLLSGIVVVDLRGIIREFSPAVTPILNYLTHEVVGSPVNNLFPLQYRAKWMEEFLAAGQNPDAIDPMKELFTYALAKGGSEIPVSIRLHGWRAGSEGFVTLTITQRLSSKDSHTADQDTEKSFRSEASLPARDNPLPRLEKK